MKKNNEISPAGEAGWQEAVLNLEKRIEKRLLEELSRKADNSEQQTAKVLFSMFSFSALFMILCFHIPRSGRGSPKRNT
jgi:hypothetical protein